MPAVTLINAVPVFSSPDEHRELVASTPASFNDIPPVIRFKGENVSVTLEPSIEGFTAQDSAQGTLFILESVLVFMSATGRGFQIEYPAITLHAVSRANSGPSIYCQLDEQPESGETSLNTELDGANDMRELSIIPPDPTSLDPIFEALSVCASLHPDKATGSDDDDMDDAFFTNGTGNDGGFQTFTGTNEQELSEVGRAALEHLESIISDPQDNSGYVQKSDINGVASEGESEEDVKN